MKVLSFSGGAVLGLVVGGVLALGLRPASETSCCKRVKEGFRDELRDALTDRWGGTAGAVGVSLADRFGITDNSPALLDLAGL